MSARDEKRRQNKEKVVYGAPGVVLIGSGLLSYEKVYGGGALKRNESQSEPKLNEQGTKKPARANVAGCVPR